MLEKYSEKMDSARCGWNAPIKEVVLACCLLIFCVGSAMAAGSINAVSFGDGALAFSWPPAASFYLGGGWELQGAESGAVVARW